MKTITIDINRLGLQLAYEKVSGTVATYKAVTAAIRSAVNDDDAMMAVIIAEDAWLEQWKLEERI
ncbi:MAG: hypothetical protein LIO91_03680 [Bacteroidales bacterium]|nr:hypothetical protein [Bacteroidales bacterium]